MKMLLLSLVTLVATSAFAGSDSAYSYQISNKGNCKQLVWGEYQGQNVDAGWCAPINGYPKGSYVKYEWSNKKNCKIMINGEFTNTFADYSYCAAND